MSKHRIIDRRRLLLGGAASGLMLAGGGQFTTAFAQSSKIRRPVQQIDALEARARQIGLATPRGEAARSILRPADREAYSEMLPRLVDLIDRADGAGQGAKDLAEEAADLLGRIHRAERSLAPEDPAERGVKPTFDSLKAEYRQMFEKCAIEGKFKSKVDQHVESLKKNRPRYEKVCQPMDIPWYFVGIIHALEAGFNFRTHLHNGDPLSARTFQVPKNRPAVWGPPNDWESSADDALRIKNFNAQKDWTLEQTLYRWELYNGFGYRNKRGADGRPVFSPYLWSFSNQYKQGKYVRDGVWDPSAVSQQCGACTMLKGLIEAGDVTPL